MARLDEHGRVELLVPDDTPGTITFVWEHVTPERPHGDDVLVVFDAAGGRVLSATDYATGRPLDPQSLRPFRASLAANMELAGSWEVFRREFIRVIPEEGVPTGGDSSRPHDGLS